MCKVVKMRKKLYQDQIQILLQILMRSNSMFFSFLNQECFHLQEYLPLRSRFKVKLC